MQYLCFYIETPLIQARFDPAHGETLVSGTTNQVELPTSTVRELLIPLPPLAEQRRIVAKIDQLMARCDELERLREEQDRKRLAVHTAAIKELLAEAASFAPSRLSMSDFLFRHFGDLYTVKENVAELRKAILQLAVMGKLVPQDPNDPPASELLKQIAAEKERLTNHHVRFGHNEG